MMTQAQDIGTEEETRLKMLIQARLGGRVCGLRILRRDNAFVLQGRAPTYYAKQLILHTAMQATTLTIIADEIEVSYADEGRHISCEQQL